MRWQLMANVSIFTCSTDPKHHRFSSTPLDWLQYIGHVDTKGLRHKLNHRPMACVASGNHLCHLHTRVDRTAAYTDTQSTFGQTPIHIVYRDWYIHQQMWTCSLCFPLNRAQVYLACNGRGRVWECKKRKNTISCPWLGWSFTQHTQWTMDMQNTHSKKSVT